MHPLLVRDVHGVLDYVLRPHPQSGPDMGQLRPDRVVLAAAELRNEGRVPERLAAARVVPDKDELIELRDMPLPQLDPPVRPGAVGNINVLSGRVVEPAVERAP